MLHLRNIFPCAMVSLVSIGEKRMYSVVKRDGKEVPFDISKITVAIQKASSQSRRITTRTSLTS